MLQRDFCRESVSFDFVPREEFDTWRLKLAAIGSTFVSNSGEMLERVRNLIPKYDPDGNCCKGSCISYLAISHHGGGAGIVPLSTDGTEGFNYLAEVAYQQRVSAGRLLTSQQEKDRSENEAALSVFRQLAERLCRGATVSIVMCNSEFGDGGPYSLKNRLQSAFGSDKRIETFTGQCGLRFGKGVEVP